MTERHTLTRYAWLSIAAATATISLKLFAYWLTNSIGLLADALESLVNLAAAVMALWMLTIAARPADHDHAYGHGKAEYFAGAIEGMLIILAAGGIGWTAIQRLFAPQPLDHTVAGLAVAGIATLINGAVAFVLLRAGRRHESLTLEADGQHLLTDVWTSVAVVAGIGLVALTGWYILDPLIALAVAVNITVTGVQLVRRAVLGLMDTALPDDELAAIRNALADLGEHGCDYHALRTRQSGARRFISFHLLVPDTWSIQQAHAMAEQVEAAVRAAVPNSTVFTHLEPRNDPAALADIALDREAESEAADAVITHR
ncbi:cation diffusion facilitator family transporter [Chloroflexus sp.]|uniref:cation diffusion facilitator family transporter n=1 Tax=Chloroflexus sp. TaxID=1904827 RepID=UPI002ACE9DDF|nr:cation diffusion facilitator family transporter [Chloroflexus sp.]